jgi:hypothetical protein
MSKQLTELLVTVTGKAFGVLVEESDALSVRREFVRYVNTTGIFKVAPRYLVKYFELLEKGVMRLERSETDLLLKIIKNWYWSTIKWLMPTYYEYMVKLVGIAKKLCYADADDMTFVEDNVIKGKIFDMEVGDEAYKTFARNADMAIDKKQYGDLVATLCNILRRSFGGCVDFTTSEWRTAGKLSEAALSIC